MKYTGDELMDEFYRTKVKGTELDPGSNSIKGILDGPWGYLKNRMENGNLNKVRFKYFGTFVVHPVRALGLLDKFRKRYKEQRDPPEKFLRKTQMIKKFLEDGSVG